MAAIDYEKARALLEREFASVEKAHINGTAPAVDESIQSHFDKVFQSNTKAYREVLLGCLLARMIDKTIDIRLPYVQHGENAYSGRSLDERVVNPFLHDKRIPSSKGPFLAAFRRSVRFVRQTGKGLKDKEGYTAFLRILDAARAAEHDDKILALLRQTLYRFITLRTSSEIEVYKLSRLSLEQCTAIIDGLLQKPSGGRFPVLLVEATLSAIKESFDLSWTIETQDINVADEPSGAGGDVTVRQGEAVVLAAEVTERKVGKERLVSTFQSKISPQGIEDYLFLVTSSVDEDAMVQARRYFRQGHEVNFLQITDWIKMVLATLGRNGRDFFNKALVKKMQSEETPATLKVAWNEQIAEMTSS